MREHQWRYWERNFNKEFVREGKHGLVACMLKAIKPLCGCESPRLDVDNKSLKVTCTNCGDSYNISRGTIFEHCKERSTTSSKMTINERLFMLYYFTVVNSGINPSDIIKRGIFTSRDTVRRMLRDYRKLMSLKLTGEIDNGRIKSAKAFNLGDVEPASKNGAYLGVKVTVYAINNSSEKSKESSIGAVNSTCMFECKSGKANGILLDNDSLKKPISMEKFAVKFKEWLLKNNKTTYIKGNIEELMLDFTFQEYYDQDKCVKSRCAFFIDILKYAMNYDKFSERLTPGRRGEDRQKRVSRKKPIFFGGIRAKTG